MSSALLLRAYRLAVQREARVWALQAGFTSSGSGWVPPHILAYWADCRAKQGRYARLCRRLEARLLTRLGAPPK